MNLYMDFNIWIVSYAYYRFIVVNKRKQTTSEENRLNKNKKNNTVKQSETAVTLRRFNCPVVPVYETSRAQSTDSLCYWYMSHSEETLPHASACHNISKYIQYVYTLYINIHIEGTAELAYLTFLPVARWYLATFDLWPLSAVVQGQTCSAECSGTPTQALQSETLKNHFKSCAQFRLASPGPASPRLASPPASVLPLFAVALLLRAQVTSSLHICFAAGNWPLLLSKKPAGDARQSARVRPQQG